MMRFLLAGFTMFAMLTVGIPSKAAPRSPLVAGQDWLAYKQKFLDPSGRIIDDGNGKISHSEGQGYGLLLAYLAGSRADFDLIWSFTRTELLLRDDGLAVWKWDPSSSPHVSDVNNATDGDILIAYALAKAGKAWRTPEFTAAAADMVKAVAATGLLKHEDRFLVMPAATGFSMQDRGDGPVVNLSYWIYEAFPVFAELDPQTDWRQVAKDGLNLLAMGEIGPKRLPPDWLSLKASPRPADGFPPDFGYNALRVPLYLLRGGVDDSGLLSPFSDLASTGGFGIADIATGNVREVLRDPGYRLIPALVECVLNDTPVPAELTTFAPTLYYPSTLQLLGLAYLAEHEGECR